MARWYKVDAVMRNLAAEKQAELLSTDPGDTSIIRPVMLDLSRIETYTAMYDDEGDVITTQSLITTHSGIEMVLNISFLALDKLIRNESEKPNTGLK